MTALDDIISVCDVDGLLLKADTELRRKICQDARAELEELRATASAQADTIEQARAMSKRWKYACKFHKHFHHEYRKMSEYFRKERNLKVLSVQNVSEPLET
jgi:vacuolar-type H+-ATPase subunit E/Vma4